MKVKYWLSLFIQVVFCTCIIPNHTFGDDNSTSIFPPKDQTVLMLKKVCDRQLSEEKIFRGKSWSHGFFFAGVMALYRTAGEGKYLDAAITWAEKNNWRISRTLFRFKRADNLCAGQTFIDLYTIKHDPVMIKSTQKTLDAIIQQSPDGMKEWWWCDALFMAPPVFAHFAAVTKQSKYLSSMNRMWWESTENLYDSKEYLFFRDHRFKKRKNDSSLCDNPKIFWARGQGWVMAGIVRVLQYMPKDYLYRPQYIQRLKEMVEKIVSLERKNNLWYPNLLCPKQYPYQESSSSALFCYALAWGVNNNILEPAKYLSVIQNTWNGLTNIVDTSGNVGWVQKKGFKPAKVEQRDTGAYGVGAFLLAGSEVVKLTK